MKPRWMNVSEVPSGESMLTLFEVPGQKDIQLQLAESERVAGIVRGTVSWLATGLKIEETQYVHVMN